MILSHLYHLSPVSPLTCMLYPCCACIISYLCVVPRHTQNSLPTWRTSRTSGSGCPDSSPCSRPRTSGTAIRPGSSGSGSRTGPIHTTSKRAGRKLAKDRITIMLCFSLMGILGPFLAIGTAVRPRCFGRTWHPTHIGVQYDTSKKAWMTGVLFLRYLKHFRYASTMLCSLCVIFRSCESVKGTNG